MARFSKSSLARLLTSTTPAPSSSFYLRHFSESAEPQRNIWISLFNGNRLLEGRSKEMPKDSRKIQIEKTSQPRVFGKSEKTSKSTEEIDEIDHLNFLEQTWRYINETPSDINSLRWKNNMINIIHTLHPAAYFTPEVEKALPAFDCGILVLCSVGGVQSKSIILDKIMRSYKLPRLVYINKLDHNGANPWEVLDQARSKLKHHTAAVQIPIGLKKDFKGLVDLVQLKAYYFNGLNRQKVAIDEVSEEVPADMKALVSEKRRELIETVSKVDDKLAEAFCSDKPISATDLENAVRRATIARKFIPAFMGNTFQYNKGLQLLLDGVINYLPCPIEASNYTLDQSKHGEKHTLVALSVTMKREYGQVTYLRIYEGVVRKGDFITNANTDKTFEVPHLFRKCNDVFKVIEEANAGEIVAVFNATGFTDGLVSYTMTSIDVSKLVSRDSDVQGKGDVYLPFVKVYGGKGRLVLMKSISGLLKC